MELIRVLIPKTACISRNAAIREMGYRIDAPWKHYGLDCAIWNPHNLWNLDHAEYLRRWDEHLPQILARAKEEESQVCGWHTPVTLFEGIWPEAKRVTWVRDPARVLISGFYFFPHMEQCRGDMQGMTIGDYIRLPNVVNHQSVYLGGDLGNFDFVGVVERIKKDWRKLSKMMGWPRTRLPYHNQQQGEYRQRVRRHLADKQLMADIRRIHREDYELYEQAVSG